MPIQIIKSFFPEFLATNLHPTPALFEVVLVVLIADPKDGLCEVYCDK